MGLHDLLKNRRQAFFFVSAGLAVIFAGFVVCSGYRAKAAADGMMRRMSDGLPYYSTRLAMNPNRHMSSRNAVASKPGWIVTYANESGSSAVAFYVTFSGKVQEVGDPLLVPRVAQHEESVRKAWDAFDEKFVAVDRVIVAGMPYDDVVAILGPPSLPFTNDGYVFTDYFFKARQAPKSHQGRITNGFSLVFSNNVLFRKGYSY